MKLFTKQKWSYRVKEKNIVTKGEGKVRDVLGYGINNICTTIYKIDNHQGPTVYHKELCSLLCNMYVKII